MEGPILQEHVQMEVPLMTVTISGGRGLVCERGRPRKVMRMFSADERGQDQAVRIGT